MKQLIKIALVLLLSTTIFAKQVGFDPDFPPEEIDPNTHTNYDFVYMEKLELQIDSIDFTNKKMSGKITEHMRVQFGPNEAITLDIWNGVKLADEHAVVVTYYPDPDSSQVVNAEYSITEKDDDPNGDILTVTVTEENFSLNYNELIVIDIYFEASDGYGLSWVAAENTVDKQLPMVYSLFEPIFCRTFIPVQDTPQVKFTWKAVFQLPTEAEYSDLTMFMAGKLNEAESNMSTKKYVFEQDQGVSTFNLAFYIGKLEEISLGYIEEGTEQIPISVIAESSQKDLVEKDFADLKDYIQNQIDVIGISYAWWSYKLAIMPKNFPLQGGAFPELNYAPPSILYSGNQGKSLIMHDIAKNWFGNKVSAGNWRNIWLNEGFSLYLERQSYAKTFGDDYKAFDEVLGDEEMKEFIEFVGEDNEWTKLFPDTTGQDPTEVFNIVASEKGYQFLVYLRSFMADDSFHAMINDWIVDHESRPVEWEAFQKFFEKWVKNNIEFHSFLEEIDWDAWIQNAGYIPADTVKFQNDKFDAIKALVDKLLQFQGTAVPTEYHAVENLSNKELYAFLDLFMKGDNIYMLNKRLIKQIDQMYYIKDNMFTDHNLRYRWYALNIYGKNDLTLKDEIDEFVSNNGRSDMVVPIYAAYAKMGQAKLKYARDTLYYKYRPFYHTITQKDILDVLG